MSSSAYYHRMSESELKELTSDGKRLRGFQHGIDGDVITAAKRMLDLDYFYDAMHFLLTGKAMPPTLEPDGDILSLAICGGEPIGEDFTGYGPARVLTVAQVKQIAAAVEKLQFKKLRSKFSDDDLENASDSVSHFDDPEEMLEGLEECFPLFKSFYLDAAKNGEVVVNFWS